VLQNVRLALQRPTGLSLRFWQHERVLSRLDAQAMEALEQVDLAALHGLRAGELSYGRKRALELATTLAANPRLMLLDEPTQGMGHEDVARVTDLIRRVAVGRTVLMVEHNMSVVAGLCDRITVMQRGEILAEGSYDEVASDPRVRDAYMGHQQSLQEVVRG
jgi:branched-chain amino acid transport system ATP-binding protein